MNLSRSSKLFLVSFSSFLLLAMVIGAVATVRHNHTEDICVGTAPPMGSDTVCMDAVVWPGEKLAIGDILPMELVYQDQPAWLAKSAISSVVVTVNGTQVETVVQDNDIVVTVP